jgi:hypothetical protein
LTHLSGAPRGSASFVDELYGEFVATLPPPLADAAAALAVTLGLAPSRDVPWSEVFAHEVTLGGPALLAEAMPEVGWDRVRDATLAHFLAVLDAFASDRIEDRQVEPSPVLEELLSRARHMRDTAFARVFDGASVEMGGDPPNPPPRAPVRAAPRTFPMGGDPPKPPPRTYTEAALETLEATRAEHVALREVGVPFSTGTLERASASGPPSLRSPYPFDHYLSIARGKQRLGFPASLALAHAAGWSARRVACVAGVLDGVTLGLQLHDDVIDWEDDLARGGAWAACLAGVVERQDRASVRAVVHQSGVLAHMLAASAHHFRVARRRASLLGARRLAEWAGAREVAIAELAQRERGSPGFANRAHALWVWSKTVLDGGH